MQYLQLTEKLRKPKKFLKRSKKTTRKQISGEFVVHCVNGNQPLRAVGCALIATRPNTFSAVVGRVGILLKLAAFVRLALIVGVGHRVCVATVGRNTTIGMKSIQVKSKKCLRFFVTQSANVQFKLIRVFGKKKSAFALRICGRIGKRRGA